MRTDLKELIDAILQDGVITEKERAVLHEKAKRLGEDPNEVDIYLDAEAQKREQEGDAIVRKMKSKTCPYCGGGISQLEEECPHCHRLLSATADEELTDLLEHLEEALVLLKTGKDVAHNKAMVEHYSHKATIYYSQNPKVQTLLKEIEQEKQKATQNVNKAVRDAQINSIFKYIFITNKKIIIAIVAILIVIFAIKAIVDYVNPDPNEVIAEAIETGNTEKAAYVYKLTTDISLEDKRARACDIIRSYMEQKQYGEAATFLQSLDDSCLEAPTVLYRTLAKKFFLEGFNKAIEENNEEEALRYEFRYRDAFGPDSTVFLAEKLAKSFIAEGHLNQATDLVKNYPAEEELIQMVVQAYVDNKQTWIDGDADSFYDYMCDLVYVVKTLCIKDDADAESFEKSFYEIINQYPWKTKEDEQDAKIGIRELLYAN